MIQGVVRPPRFEHHRYLGDKRSQVLHDLDSVGERCGLSELLASEQFATFGPDTVPEARNRGYRPCRHCITTSAG